MTNTPRTVLGFEPLPNMINPLIIRYLAKLDVEFVHEHTALCVSDIHRALDLYKQLGYKRVGPTNTGVIFLENENSRLEIMPNGKDFVPHEAFAFLTSNAYEKAVNYFKQFDRMFGQVDRLCDIKERLKYTTFRYVYLGTTHYIQLIWRAPGNEVYGDPWNPRN